MFSCPVFRILRFTSVKVLWHWSNAYQRLRFYLILLADRLGGFHSCVFGRRLYYERDAIMVHLIVFASSTTKKKHFKALELNIAMQNPFIWIFFQNPNPFLWILFLFVSLQDLMHYDILDRCKSGHQVQLPSTAWVPPPVHYNQEEKRHPWAFKWGRTCSNA